MAAPSATTWGNIITGSNSSLKGRIGIYTGITTTATAVTVKVEVWFWSMYSVDDNNNKYYYNSNATSATTLIGSKNINHTVKTGEGWSTANQTKLGESTITYSRGTSAATKSFAAKFTGIEILGSSNVMTATKSVTIPALASYTVSYNANGGTGAPGNQTKWYGKSLTLSSTKPTRTGHTFKGWATSANGSVVNQPGGTYTGNAAVTYYAIWQADTYEVSYDANGGSGAPTAQTKTYGKTLALSTVKPTRANYTFKGWATSSGGSVVYAAGANYTANSAATLYAVWELAYTKPRINGLVISRCDTDKNTTDDGIFALVAFGWASDKAISAITIEWKLSSSSTYATADKKTVSASGTSGAVNEKVGGNFDPEKTYTFRITVKDSTGSSTSIRNMSGSMYYFDCKPPKAEGEVGGAAVGKPAELDGVFDVGFVAKFSGGMASIVAEKVSDLNDLKIPNTYVSVNKGAESYANAPAGLSGTFTIEVLSAGAEGQLLQRLTVCSKTFPREFIRHYYQGAWGAWKRMFEVELYNNTSGSTDEITLSESAANFKYIEVFFTDNNNKAGGYTKVYSPDGKTLALSIVEAGNDINTYIRRTHYAVSGTKITPDKTSATYVRLNSNLSKSETGGYMRHASDLANYIKIVRVVGHE